MIFFERIFSRIVNIMMYSLLYLLKYLSTQFFYNKIISEFSIRVTSAIIVESKLHELVYSFLLQKKHNHISKMLYCLTCLSHFENV